MSKSKTRTKRTRRKAAVDFTGDECYYDEKLGALVADGTQRVLRDIDDKVMRDEYEDECVLQEALCRDRDSLGPTPRRTAKDVAKNGFPRQTVQAICDAYMAYRRLTTEADLLEYIEDTLFDFCTGLPERLREPVIAGELTEHSLGHDRIHTGYGSLAADECRCYVLTQWISVHSDWHCKARCRNWETPSRIRVIQRTFNWAESELLVESNWFQDFKIDGENDS